MAVVKKAKKKEMVSLISPKVFGETEIAEFPTSDVSNLIGKKATFNMVEVIPDSNKYYTKATFRIKSVDGKKAFTDFDSLELMRDYISRMVVRRVKRIDLIMDLLTKDGFRIRVKGLATTSRKASSNVEKSVRNKIGEMIEKAVKENDLQVFLNGVLSDEFKRSFIKELRKIYPLRNFEFRKIEGV